MKPFILAAALALGVTPALAAEKYVLDASHSQVIFSYNHLGFSTTYGMFSGFEGEISFDEATGDNTAKITGDLSMNDVTKSVVLDAKLNKADTHPMAGKPWMGFDATTTLKRSDFGVGAFAPAVSDEVEVTISIEAMKAE